MKWLIVNWEVTVISENKYEQMLLEINELELDRLTWVLSLGSWTTFNPTTFYYEYLETFKGKEGGMEGGTEGQREQGRKELNQGNPYTYCLLSIIVNIFYIYFLHKHTRTHSHIPPSYFQWFQNKWQTSDPLSSKYFGVHLQKCKNILLHSHHDIVTVKKVKPLILSND